MLLFSISFKSDITISLVVGTEILGNITGKLRPGTISLGYIEVDFKNTYVVVL